RNRQPECARTAPVLARGLDGDIAAQAIRGVSDVARADAERQRAVVGHPFALYAREPSEVHGLVFRPALRRAVREAPADARIAQGAQLRVRMLGRADVVGPVVHRSRAGAESLGKPQAHAAIAVLRSVVTAEGVGDREVAALRVIDA